MRRFLITVLFGALTAAPTTARAQYVSPQSQAVVNEWYNRFFHRQAELAAVGWAQVLDQGQNPDRVLAGILGSDEYYLRSGGTPQSYVQTLFIDLNGRQPSRAEYSFWTNRLLRVGGAAPDFEERVDLAYAMLTRYPQNWQGAAPAIAAPPVIAPTIVVPPVYNYGRRYGDRDDYEYRRPYVPSVRWERDHREEHDRDHHDDHDRRR